MEYRKIVIETFGGPERLKIGSFRSSEIGVNQVGVRVLAAGVGFSDVMAQRGGYLLARKTPLTPGYDFVGIIEEIGSSVSGFAVGDYVGGLKPDLGCYSEYMNIDPGFLVKVPQEIKPVKAVALILNYLTASCALHQKANIQKGESLLIHGAGGGVGTALMQMGRQLELKMYGTASRRKHHILGSYGVEPIDYRNEDFVNFIRHSEKSGVDVVVDSFGTDYIKRSYKCLKAKGRLICIGMSGKNYGGYRSAVSSLLQIIRHNMIPDDKRIRLCATPHEAKTNLNWYKNELSTIFKKCQNKQLNPLIGEILPFDQVARAHQLIEDSKVAGKIVLKMKD